MNNTTRGLLVLSAVAALSAQAADKNPAPKKEKEAATVRCDGANECKGKGECGSATYACAGNNECKGKGWVVLTEAECKKKGGKPNGAASM